MCNLTFFIQLLNSTKFLKKINQLIFLFKASLMDMMIDTSHERRTITVILETESSGYFPMGRTEAKILST